MELNENYFNRDIKHITEQLHQDQNTRLSELEALKKSRELSKEEMAELLGHRVYPNNPKAAKLEMECTLGTISSVDKQVLFKMRRESSLSPELNQIYTKIDHSNPNVLLADMNDSKTCKVLPNDGEKIILTNGLGGCFASVIVAEYEDGTKEVKLMHYDPLHILKNTIDIDNTNPLITDAKYKTALILTEKQFDYNSDKYENNSQLQIDSLITALKSKLGNDTKIIIEQYPTDEIYGTKDFGSLVIRIPEEGQVTYETWYSKGQLGKTDEDELLKHINNLGKAN